MVSIFQADRIVARDADSLHTGEYIKVSDATEHLHEGQKIGDKYPKLGYGGSISFLLLGSKI